MAKFSQKVKGKEVGQAAVYAAPHTMKGKATSVQADSKYTPGAKVIGKSIYNLDPRPYRTYNLDGLQYIQEIKLKKEVVKEML